MTTHIYKVGDKGMTRGGEAYEVTHVVPDGTQRFLATIGGHREWLYPDGTYNLGADHHFDLLPPKPADAPMKAEPVRVTHAVVARLIKLLPGLEYARETHVHWANCSSEARDRNPDIGDKAFHDECVREYDECIAAITDAIAALKATLQS